MINSMGGGRGEEDRLFSFVLDFDVLDFEDSVVIVVLFSSCNVPFCIAEKHVTKQCLYAKDQIGPSVRQRL